MRCHVPGCSSIYTPKKSNTLRFFKAITETQLQMWQEILLRYGVDDFTANHVICALHFKEDDIEKYRIEFKTGGLAYIVPIKRHALRYNAVPTIFPSNIKLNKRKIEYAVKLDDETLAKQKEMFRASCALDAQDKPVKEKMVRKKAVKRKISTGSSTAEDPVLMAKKC
ncbi:uncharacterized protein LOC117172618 [Belonocnema kinseyi]|uniref:uncharacterized protein LOC117172618 n=1 Tax=Belonocnema kinseyi TaxID=2817044 RepID=UPI00143D90D1|nr:uncharacterized protein LOC117172618 [Belonocnema kinseyi]